MENNGYKQATVAYKTDQDGNPVDVEGVLTSISGRKQAIAVLEGRVNPNPAKYEVEFYYKEGALVAGKPSVYFAPVSCPFGYIKISPDFVVLEPSALSASFRLESSNAWKMIGTSATFELDTVNGGGGVFDILVSLKGNPSPISETLTFQNLTTLETKTLYVAYVLAKPWVLDNGIWNNLGFWYNNGIWNF